jgi:spore coat polysaccharide biosynthesis protein SpsF
MGSTRLPGKILLPIAGKPLLGIIILRLSQLKSQVSTVVATSIESINDQVEKFCNQNNQTVFRGSEENVLERYLSCARHYGFNDIIRLTGDNPFIDTKELDRLITLHTDTKADYSTSIAKLPIGIGAEIFTINCLERIAQGASEPYHFEHVNEYLLENPKEFKIVELEPPITKNRPDIRLTVDTNLDYKRSCFIAERAGSFLVSTEKAISLAGEFETKCTASV